MEQGFFTRVGRLTVENPKRVLAVAGLFFALAGLAGNGLINHLSTGGFDDFGGGKMPMPLSGVTVEIIGARARAREASEPRP